MELTIRTILYLALMIVMSLWGFPFLMRLSSKSKDAATSIKAFAFSEKVYISIARASLVAAIVNAHLMVVLREGFPAMLLPLGAVWIAYYFLQRKVTNEGF